MSRSPVSGGDANAQCAPRLRALAAPTRLAVLRLLAVGPLHVGDLVTALGIEQSLWSHHLRILREIGMVVSRREGRRVRHMLGDGVLGRDGLVFQLGCCDLTFPSR